MATTTDAPADTAMMRIVHDALRRDLSRAAAALADPATPEARRRAIGAHLGWMMRFLRAHHRSEDAGLYPLVRARGGDDPEVREVLDRMQAGHDAIAAAITQVETDPGAASLAALADVLLPHLRDEEDEAMPIVARLVTHAEWLALEREHNLDGKSMADLGFEGHWLIDSATDTDRTTVLGLVPPVPRFALVHGFAHRYRRHTARCWTDGGAPPRRVQLENHVDVVVDAPVDAVWDVVRDVTRVGEWSHECVGGEWVDGAEQAVPGARFRGRNKAGAFRWGRLCEIVAADPYEMVWITVPTALYPDSSEWRIELAEVEGGTRISQRFRVVRAPKVLGAVYALLIPAHRDRTAGLVADLTRLGDVAARTSLTR